MAKYGNNPKKYEDHILIFNGILSGDQEESSQAKKIFEILNSQQKNPIVHTANDTLNPDTMKLILFVGKENTIEKNPSFKEFAIKYKISFIEVDEYENLENLCSTL